MKNMIKSFKNLLVFEVHIKYILVVLVPLVLSIGTIPVLPFDLIQEADAKKNVGKEELGKLIINVGKEELGKLTLNVGKEKLGKLIIKSYGTKNTTVACVDRVCIVLPSVDASTKVEAIIKISPYLQKYALFSEQYETRQETREFSPPINLSGQNLYGKTLKHLDLRYADLSYTNLRGVNLEGVDLTGANLQSSFLYNANLDGAILIDANLSNSTMIRTYGRGADFSNANLSNVDLRWADFRKANMTNTNFQNANMFRSNFAGADFYLSDKTGAGLGTTNMNDCLNHPACKWTVFHTDVVSRHPDQEFYVIDQFLRN